MNGNGLNNHKDTALLEPVRPSIKLGWWASIIMVLSVFGPGIITGNFGNDAGGITTYSICGAKYGYQMLWTIVPVLFVLLLYQNMSGTMGIITGKGLAELIREQFGVKTAFYVVIAKFIAGIANTTAEFAGVAAAVELFGSNKYAAIPIAAFLVWMLTIKTNYKKIERIFLIGCSFFAAYVVSGIIALKKPDWIEIGGSLARPDLGPLLNFDRDYWLILIALIGTTLAPWMPFYHQSAVVEKGMKKSDFKYYQWETLGTGLSVGIVIFFIIVTCGATLHKNGIQIQTADEAARALGPMAGVYAKELFAIGLLVASLGAAIILPLSTAFSVSETFGWESGVNKKFAEAPQFYTLYTISIVIGASIVLLPGISLIKVMLFSQAINGLILPIVLVLMALLRNNKKLMAGECPGLLYNIILVTATILISAAAVITVVVSLK
ncbi:MAG: Nramp family divalent metal transporter [Planctomycetes bacterium]|nr:Nramp family divalent metal transporter [Planctomycetota bacterium]